MLSSAEVQPEPKEIPPPAAQAPEPPKQKSWLVIGLTVLVLLLLGVAGYFAYQNYQLKQQVLQKQPTSLPEATKTPEAPSPVPTKDLQGVLTPTITPSKEINYGLPLGWKTIKDSNNQFEIGFNPKEFKASSYPAKIGINRKQCCFDFVIRIEPYDGGSKHSLLNQHFQGYGTISNTLEKNYLEMEGLA